MKTLVAIAAVLMAVATPAFAQSYHASWGHRYGNGWESHFRARAMQRPGERAYAMAPASRMNPDSPALTGGGSLGYNGPLDLHFQ